MVRPKPCMKKGDTPSFLRALVDLIVIGAFSNDLSTKATVSIKGGIPLP